jgi:hypothetical protein
VSSAPTLDGDIKEWGTEGWSSIAVKPAVKDDEDNHTGNLTVEYKAVIADSDLYIASRWPDKKPDEEYKNWVWKKKKYKRGDKVDDMFAVRFDMDGDYDACMIAEKTYKVDLWVWSAGRSNPAGFANDMWHLITTNMIENAAEYKGPTGKMVYIKKYADEGTPIFENTKPDRKKFTEKKLPGIQWPGNPSGSVADVQAKGVWSDGYWSLEMKRSLDTKNPDDVVFKPGESIIGSIAVYNKGAAEHKSVSGDLTFQFSK